VGGGAGVDTLLGSRAPDAFYGLVGDDLLYGGRGPTATTSSTRAAADAASGTA
jgi:hypothetical protein